jgi:hypothetical protein
MLYYSLKTLNKLEKAKEKKKQEKKKKRYITKTIVTLSVLITNLFLISNPFAKLKVSLLPPKV